MDEHVQSKRDRLPGLGPGGGRVALWSIPRSSSTVLQKCLGAIEGIEMWFEPFTFAHITCIEFEKHEMKPLPLTYEGNEAMFERATEYLSKLKIRTKINIDRVPYASLQRSLETSTSQYVLFKDHSFSMDMYRYRDYIPAGFKHSFIIRHPLRVYSSYRKALYRHLLEAGTMIDQGVDERKFDMEKHDNLLSPELFYKHTYDLWSFIRSNIDPNPVVIDSDDLLAHPESILPKYCEAVGLPYDDSLQEWDPSLTILDTWKAVGDELLREMGHFLDRSTKSSKLEAPGKLPSRDELTDDVLRLSDAAMPYYTEMYESRLKV